MSALQVERAIFTEGSLLTRARRCRASLQRLTDWGCLVRLNRRIGGVRAGSAGFVYALAPFGQRLLHPDAERLRRVREPRSAFIDHTLAVTEVCVQLREAEKAGRLTLDRFDTEPACWRVIPGFGRNDWLKPDAHVELTAGEWEHHAFIEVDLATESRVVLRRKAETYVRYWQSGEEQAVRGVFPRVLFLVPTERRLEEVVEALGQLPAEHWKLFQVGLLADVVEPLEGDGSIQDRGG